MYAGGEADPFHLRGSYSPASTPISDVNAYMYKSMYSRAGCCVLVVPPYTFRSGQWENGRSRIGWFYANGYFVYV